jgi:hypothetical protein
VQPPAQPGPDGSDNLINWARQGVSRGVVIHHVNGLVHLDPHIGQRDD